MVSGCTAGAGQGWICPRAHHSHGLCRIHAQQARRGRELAPIRPHAGRPGSVPPRARLVACRVTEARWRALRAGAEIRGCSLSAYMEAILNGVLHAPPDKSGE